MIPLVEKCFEFMKKYEMLDNIRDHSIMVEKVAAIIARGLRDAGEDISLKKTTAGALMHDIGKTICLNSNDDHAAKGVEICLKNHLDEIAEMVGEHVTLQSYNPGGSINEKEIVYYADKRVNHDVVVSLEKRLEYLLKRYGRNKEHLFELIRENFDLCKRVEEKLFAKLSFRPEEMAEMVDNK